MHRPEPLAFSESATREGSEFPQANREPLDEAIKVLVGGSSSAEAATRDVDVPALTRVLCQVVVRRRLDRDPDVGQAVVRLVAASEQFSAWRLRWLTLARRVRGADPLAPAQSVHHPAVARVLQAIERHYGDSRLCLKQAAGDARCSVWHLGRLLRRSTGMGFTAHLRRRRVRAAQVLLGESSMALKVIAAEAGFANASQFSRQFAQAVGVTPSRFRASAPKRQDAPQMTSERPCKGVTGVDNRV